MPSRRIGKAIAGCAVPIILMGFVLHFSHSAALKPRLPQSSSRSIDSAASISHRSRTAAPPRSLADTQGPPTIAPALMDSAVAPRLSRLEVEKYLERNGRSAASLLAAYGILHDLNFLREAATRFPNDPRLQLSVLRQDLFPEERRKWLDLFKISSPGNPLADYLSARDHFQYGQSDLAVSDLMAAAAKPAFMDYSMESMLNEEELNLSAGRSPLQARLSSKAWAQEVLPELDSLKALTWDIITVQREYAARGDSAFAQQMVQTGLMLAAGLRSGDAGQFLIQQLVGNAIEATILRTLNPDGVYLFMGGISPGARLAELRDQKDELSRLRRSADEALPKLSEPELLTYTERQRIFGEVEALRWLQ